MNGLVAPTWLNIQQSFKKSYNTNKLERKLQNLGKLLNMQKRYIGKDS